MGGEERKGGVLIWEAFQLSSKIEYTNWLANNEQIS